MTKKYEGVPKQPIEYMRTIWIPFQIWKCNSCGKSERYESERIYEESFCTNCGIKRELITNGQKENNDRSI